MSAEQDIRVELIDETPDCPCYRLRFSWQEPGGLDRSCVAVLHKRSSGKDIIGAIETVRSWRMHRLHAIDIENRISELNEHAQTKPQT